MKYFVGILLGCLFVLPSLAQITSAPGNALSLNGTNQYVQVPANAALETANVTVEAWVRPQWVSAAPAQLPCIAGMSKPGGSRYDIYINKNYSGVTVWNGAANLSYAYTFAQNQLYHIALVFGNTTSSLYVNGTLAATVTGTLTTATTSVPLYIGSSDGTKEYFNGLIDEVRFWNVLRTAQQIRESMHQVLAGTEAGLVAYYQLNETSGSTTSDAKNSLTGTLLNTPTRPVSPFPFGSGTVNTQVEVNGGVSFAGTNLSANYASQNGASITTTKIIAPVTAYAPPSGAAINAVLGNQYWIVNRYGSGTFSATLNFKTTEDLSAADAANPGTIQLYQRPITSDGAWSYVAAADAVDAATDMASFSNISSGLGEYLLVRGYFLSASVGTTSFCAPSSSSVSYDGTGIAFAAGNTFTAQLSDASGSFASPVTLGTLTSTSATGTIPVVLSASTITGTGYKIRVMSSNPAVAALQDNGSALTITNPLENATWSGLSTGLTAWYKLDGNGNDASVNAYNGTLAGGVTSTTDAWGTTASAMSFNGTNSGIDVGNSANLRMYSSLSISAWINISALPSSRMVIVTKYFNSESYQFYIDSGGKINLQEGSTTVTQTTGSVSLNQWVHITGTTISGSWKLYMNGIQVGSSTSGQSFLDSGGSFQIGKDGSANRFAGSMDDVRIYNRVLSAAEVSVLSNNGIASNSGPVCAGASITLSSLTATSATYAWTGPNGYTSNAQNPPAIASSTAAMAGVYSLITTRNGCSSQPQRTIVVINTVPVAPGVADVARCSNGTVTLTATGSSAGNYRWYTVSSGGVAIAGAVNATYTTTALTGTTPYWVSSMNGVCEGPRAQINAIINSPIDATLTSSATTPVCSGTGSSVTIPSSEASASYQLFRGTTAVSAVVTGGGSVNIPVTSANLISGINTLKITVTKPGCGTADLSNTVAITVNDLPAISGQPAAQNKCAGDNATFTVTATGAGIGYQWRLGTVNLNNGGSIAGATSATLTISSVTIGNAGNYNCVISGTCAPAATTTNATLTVSSGVSVSAQPVSVVKCPGENTGFSVTASGSGLSYQWKKGTTALTDGGAISGAATAVLSIAGVNASDAGNYSCVITGACGSPVTSSSVSLSLNAIPSITAQPADAAVCSGSNAGFTITAAGTALSYQWKKGSSILSDGGTITGSSTANLVVTGAGSADAAGYSCVVSGTCAPSATSAVVVLAINTVPSISTQPSPVAATAGNSAVFTVVASGVVTYQWRSGSNDVVNDARISGATTSSLTIDDLVTADAGTYYCNVTNGCGLTTSASAGLAIDKAQPVIQFTSNASGTENGQIQLSATSKSDAPFAFSISGGTGNGNITSGNILNLVGAGTIEVTASQIATADYFNASATQEITVLRDLVTGLEPDANTYFHPNPAQTEIQFVNSALDANKITLTDMRGIAVREWAIEKTDTRLSLESLSPGTYILKASTTGNKIIYQKIIVE